MYHIRRILEKTTFFKNLGSVWGVLRTTSLEANFASKKHFLEVESPSEKKRSLEVILGAFRSNS